MGVVFARRLICSMNMLYMELSYTGSLDQSTKASEHVMVQIGNTYKATASFNNCVVPSWRFFSIKWTVDYVFPFTVGVVFADRLICSMNMLYMELSYTGSLVQSTKASEHVMVQIGNTCKAMAGFNNCVVPSWRFFQLCRLLVTYSLSLWVWSLLTD